MACQSKEAKKWLCFYLIHLIFDNFEVNYLSLPESYHTNLITLYNPSFHKFVIMTWSFYQLHLSRNSGAQRSLGPTIASNVSVCSSRYEACGKFGEHERCVRVARGVSMNQLFYNIFNQMENLFSQGICLWRHERPLKLTCASRCASWPEYFSLFMLSARQKFQNLL